MSVEIFSVTTATAQFSSLSPHHAGRYSYSFNCTTDLLIMCVMSAQNLFELKLCAPPPLSFTHCSYIY